MAKTRDPQQVDGLTWYYEYPSHLLIVREIRTGKQGAGEYVQTEQIKLPWNLIEQSRQRRPKR